MTNTHFQTLPTLHISPAFQRKPGYAFRYNQQLLKHFRDWTAAPNRGRPDNAFPQGQEWATETKTSPFRSAKLLTRCGSHILLASPPATNICVCTFPFDLVSAVRDDNGVNSVLLAECLASWKRRHFWNFAVRYLQGSERRRQGRL